MNKVSIGGFTRITQKRARFLFHEGREVFMLPCKMRPDNMWIKPALMRRPDDEPDGNIPNRANLFDRIVNEYSYYNCGTNEMGYYPSFYIRGEAE